MKPGAVQFLDARRETKQIETAAKTDVTESAAIKPEAFVTADEVAQVLNVRENWVYDQASKGYMPSYKIKGIRRFRWSEIEAWVSTG